jgi:ACS family hexuronate transporter-like MFS transporter
LHNKFNYQNNFLMMKKIKNYRWVIIVLLFVATCINYLDRQIIGLLKPILEKEFNWTETNYSHIVMAFTAAYAVGLLIAGGVIDKVGIKIGYTCAVIVWSTAAMFHAIAKSVFGFSIARIILGIGEAGHFPAAVKTVAEWFPKKERALATGIFNAGTSVGVVVALFITPYIYTTYGWQAVFWITGSLGFIWLIAWLYFYEIPSKQKRLSATELAYIESDQQNETITKIQIPWRQLFAYKQTWAYVTGKFLIDPIYWFFLFWLPSYFASTFHIDLKKPSIELMIIYASTTIGSIMGGYLSSYLIKRGWRVLKARQAVLFIFACIELSVIFAQFVTNVWVAVALISLVIAVHQAWATNIFTMASDMFPKESVSSVVGIGGMAGAIGGILFPILVGYLLDTYKAFGNINIGYNILFTICGCMYLIAFMIIRLLIRKLP